MKLRDDVKSAARDFYKETGTVVSGQACNLIYYMITAGDTDPHPDWQNGFNRQAVVDHLEDQFRAIRKEEKVRDKLTTFHMLHWLSRGIDRIVPIAKAKPSRQIVHEGVREAPPKKR